MKALVYDLEIVNAIPNRKSFPVPNIRYCGGVGRPCRYGYQCALRV